MAKVEKLELKKTVDIKNKQARWNYELLDEYTAGVELKGTEIKSIRQSKINMSDAHCGFKGDELYLLNLHISPYENSSFYQHEEKRARRLLLKKRELGKLKKGLEEKGYTIVPTKLFINDRGLAKVNIALARGKKLYDKREDLKKKDQDREVKREMIR